MIRRLRPRILVLAGASMAVVAGRLSRARARPGQEPAARAAADRRVGSAPLRAVRSAHADRQHRADRRAGQPPAAAGHRPEEGARASQARPAEQDAATCIEVGGSEKKKAEEAGERAGRRGRWSRQDPPARGGPQRGPRLRGEAVEHQEARILRGPAAGGGRPPGDGPRLRAGVRVLPAGEVAQPVLGRASTTASTGSSSPRGVGP